jgi:NAD(P)-dependent dehydrogenase (short-subunit alcohol dehydrogenase family)
MDLGLRGAAVVVTGGSSGMGRAAAECLADDGARVAVLARRKAELDDTVAALGRRGSPDPLGLAVDVTDAAAVEAAFAEVGARWGALNALVNTVGPGDTGTIDTLSDAGWARSLELGLMSAVRCTRAALPWLRKAEWARIVNVSAHSTKRQAPTLIGYTAAKSALTSMSKNLAKTLAREKILVNTVSPGTFLSGGVKSWLSGMAKQRGIDPDNLEDLNRIIAEDFGEPSDLGRAGLPDEIGAVIAFLASRRNSYMTGANVNVDGGSDFA